MPDPRPVADRYHGWRCPWAAHWGFRSDPSGRCRALPDSTQPAIEDGRAMSVPRPRGRAAPGRHSTASKVEMQLDELVSFFACRKSIHSCASRGTTRYRPGADSLGAGLFFGGRREWQENVVWDYFGTLVPIPAIWCRFVPKLRPCIGSPIRLKPADSFGPGRSAVW